jgi:hypothetical protein
MQADAPAAGQPRAQARAMGLLSVETSPWLHAWAQWRVRFAYDNEQRGLTHRDIAHFVQDAAAPRCAKRVGCAETMLYLSEAEDLRRIFQAFGGLRQCCGAIAAMQEQAAFRQAEHIAASLAAAGMTEGEDSDVLALPDLSWEVTGFGQARIASARARGRIVVVRLGMMGAQEMWVVDVDGHAGCARFRQRQDAMSKMGVVAALKSYEARLRQAP